MLHLPIHQFGTNADYSFYYNVKNFTLLCNDSIVAAKSMFQLNKLHMLSRLKTSHMVDQEQRLKIFKFLLPRIRQMAGTAPRASCTQVGGTFKRQFLSSFLSMHNYQQQILLFLKVCLQYTTPRQTTLKTHSRSVSHYITG